MIACEHLDSFLERYDGFLLDIWGTLHHGDAVTSEALDFLKKLKNLSKEVILFSNSPRLSLGLKEELSTRGLPSSLYNRILTSGDDIFESFSQEKGIYKNFGKTFFHIGSPMHVLWEGTSFRPVPFLKEASFILATGLMSGRDQLAEYNDLFEEALMLNLPLVCGNTDRFVISRGEKIWCAGKLGEIYRQLDGKVSWHGKPERAFFEKALGLFKNSSRDRILVIGDGPETDLLGANELGLDSAFIAGGLFSEELQVVKGKPLSLELLTSFLKGFSVTTTYALPFLK